MAIFDNDIRERYRYISSNIHLLQEHRERWHIFIDMLYKEDSLLDRLSKVTGKLRGSDIKYYKELSRYCKDYPITRDIENVSRSSVYLGIDSWHIARYKHILGGIGSSMLLEALKAYDKSRVKYLDYMLRYVKLCGDCGIEEEEYIPDALGKIRDKYVVV